MIHIQGISKQYGSNTLFDKADAQLGSRSRMALIGPNGSGKSTLIRILLGQETPDAGSITRAHHLVIGHLAQEIPAFQNQSVLTEVMRMDGRREKLIQAQQELEAEFEKAGDNEQHYDVLTLERYGTILEELEFLDEYRLESRAKEILLGIGFKTTDFDRSLTTFSGGWLMRVALARILLMNPDLLLLDEPTNHLDLESLLWLEEFLQSFRGAMLLVSHDTAFLNRMIHEVLEIDQKKLWIYRGNLDAYALQKQEKLTLLKAQYQGQQTKIAELEQFIARFGAKASKARQAQSRAKQLEKMERIELQEDRATVRFRFPPTPHSGKEIVTVQNAAVSWEGPTGEKKTIFENLNWVLKRGSRVAIVGRNGAGKTTFLKLLSGQLSPHTGQVTLGHQVKVGYYAQFQTESLDLNQTIIETLEKTAPDLPVSQVRAIAGCFLFTGKSVEKKCQVLSGGEKARVVLAQLLLSPANFLILDEPTNHLDVESRGVLLDALKDYQGTLCLVSHDRAFMAPLVDSVLEIQTHTSLTARSSSQVVQLLGGYESYLERQLKEISKNSFSPPKQKKPKDPSSPPESPASPSSKRSSESELERDWKREQSRLELEIADLEKTQLKLQTMFADTQLYQNQSEFQKLIQEQRMIEKNLAQKLSRWEELSRLLIKTPASIS